MMAHKAEIVDRKVVQGGVIAILVRCCGDEASDSWHTKEVLAEHTQAQIRNWKNKVLSGAMEDHEVYLKARKALEEL